MTPADFDKRITFKEFEGRLLSVEASEEYSVWSEPSLRTLLLRHYTKFFTIKESEDYAHRYIAQMCEEVQE